MKRKLLSKDPLTKLINHIGICTWEDLLDYVKALPYGRNSNRTDFQLVITEKRGTCSSKHAMLKHVADVNTIPTVKLILGMYKMNGINTPNIGKVLVENGLDYIPEAHCYLKINGKRVDITTAQSDFERLEKDLIQELEIQPEQVAEFKIEYHKDFLKKWNLENKLNLHFKEIWKIRETCIANLTQTTSVK